MAAFNSDTRGGIDDRVRIALGREETQVVESYSVKQGFLTQPSTWSLTLGHGNVVRELLERYPPNTPYKLYIGEVLQQSGAVDDQETSGAGGATVTLTGRDALAPFVDGFVEADKSFTNATYADLVRAVCLEVLGYVPDVAFSNDSNRKVQTGTKILQANKTLSPEGVRTYAAKERPIQAKAGERWYKFLRDQLDRAGLFLFASAAGGFILTSPSPSQTPVARIVRRRGQATNDVNVLSHRYRNGTAARYSRCVIHGRGGGGPAGRQKTRSEYIDTEMAGYGIDRPLVIRDAKVATAAQADAISRRRIAEARRAGWSLSYTLAGHTAPKIDGRDRIVWAVDTIVEVDDQEMGLRGNYWVESVEFSRNPHTTTTITLMRPEDLVFGGEDE